MRRLLAIIVSLLVALNFVWVKPAPVYAAPDYSMIRVKLTSLSTKTSIPVTVQGGYSIKENPSIQLEQKAYTVRLENGKLVLTDGSNSWNLGTKFTFQRNHGSLRINNGANYLGDMEFRVEGSSISLINHIHLELYLYGVVPSEMPNSWDVEALKAQAVAARTYAVEKIRVRASQAYHIVDTQSDQVYGGYNKSTSRSIQAVNATMGQVLKYGNNFAQTYYSSSNGGTIERAGNIFTYDLPYSHVKDDPYDIKNPSNPRATWTIKYKKTPVDPGLQNKISENIKSSLQKRGYSTENNDIIIQSLKEFTVDYNDSGRLDSGKLVVILDAKKTDGGTVETIEETVNLTKNTTRSFLNLYSLLFKVETTEDEIILKGGGFGHGVGMSQYGAWQMAKEGKSFTEILDFYYPGTSLASLGIKAPQDPDYIPEASPNPSPTPSPKPSPSPEPTKAPASYGRVKVNTSLNIRQGAGTKYKIIGSLKNNARVEIIGESGQWYKIKTGSLTGYVSKTYIVLESQPSKPEPTPPSSGNPSPPTDPALPPNQEKRTGIVTASSLNIRSGPGTKNHVVGMVVKGKKVTVYEKTGEWYRITYNGINGYVHSSYIQIQQDQTQAPSNPTTANPITVTLRKGSKGSQVKLLQQRLKELGYNCGAIDGSFGSQTLSAVRAFQKDRGLKVDGVVGPQTRAALNAGGSASAPKPETKPSNPAPSDSTSSNPITVTLRKGNKGSQVKLLQQRLKELGYNCGAIDGSFGSQTLSAVRAFQKDYGLKVDGVVGPQTRAALNSNSSAPSSSRGSTAKMAIVTASSLNVRSGAGTGYRIIGSLKRNAQIEILSRSGSWYKIRYGNLTGYVHGDYLSVR